MTKPRSEYTAKELADLEKAGFGVTDDGRRVFGYNHKDALAADFQITYTDARDPEKYQAIRQAAEKAGKLPQLVPDQDTGPALDNKDATFVMQTDPVLTTMGQAKNPVVYQAAKAKAAELGVELKMVEGD